MSFPRYPKYKDSGVEWLGEVPEHWEVTRAGSLGAFTSSGIDKKLVEGEVPVQMFNYLDVYKSNDKVLRYSASLMETTAPASKVDEHSVAEGDILLTPSSETRDDIGHAARVAEMPCPVVYSYHVIRLRLQHRQTAPYVTYALNAAPVRAYFEAVCTGTTRMVLVRDDLKNAPVAIPSPPEQAAIATFLDRETAKIDSLVAEQQRLIELLKEKRQAVISHAVTKGLNPDAKMKDSGIEWLDLIPAHWRAVPVKHLAAPGAKTFTDGDWIESPYITEQGVRLIQTGNVGIGVYKEQGFRYVTHETYEALRCTEVRPNDVLICRLDGPVGRACLVPDLGVRMITSVDNAILKVSPHASAAFVVAMMSSLPWLSWIDALCRVGGGFRLRVSRGQLGELRVPLPPRAEQDAIMDRISSHAESCNALADRAARAISLLQERRSALISAAVTGQIDVRGLTGSEAA